MNDTLIKSTLFAFLLGSVFFGLLASAQTIVPITPFVYKSVNPNVIGTQTTSSLNVSLLGSGSTQCAQISATGTFQGTGSPCGAGIGGSDSNWTFDGVNGITPVTSTNMLGLGLTPTSKLTVRAANVGSSTVGIQGLAGQTAFLLRITSSTAASVYFIISASGTITATTGFNFGNATGTNLNASSLTASSLTTTDASTSQISASNYGLFPFLNFTSATGTTLTFTHATGTDIGITGYVSSSQIFANRATTTTSFDLAYIASGNCLHTTTGGAVVGTGSDCGSGGGGSVTINNITTSTYIFSAGGGISITSSTSADGTGNILIRQATTTACVSLMPYVLPDTNGEASIAPDSLQTTNSFIPKSVLYIGTSTVTGINNATSGFNGVFRLPDDYVGTSSIRFTYSSPTSSATNVILGFAYNLAGEADSLDFSSFLENVTSTAANPTTVFTRKTLSINLTSSNFTQASNTIAFYLYRDRRSGFGDNQSSTVMIYNSLFCYQK